AVACLGGAAYAATGLDQSRPADKRGPNQPQAAGEGPPRPSFIETPLASGVDPDSQFRFHVPPRSGTPGSAPSRPVQPVTRRRAFECRLDDGEWSPCSSPYILVDLDPELHSFAVRALNRREEFGKAAHYRWTQLEPMEFTIEPLFGQLPELMPGDPAQELSVRISNPNPAAIEVTSLEVSVVPDRPGCPADPNFAITPAGLSPQAPLSIPAGGSATLPAAAAAPTLALRDLPVDQNACQGASLQLTFSGQAHG
ncbi:MAG TPA: hypothetical protein VFU11_10660, partial [Solirubrobacterales bacterium]|nr:hypothetical protein [Solirubrobacterales bacterium]